MKNTLFYLFIFTVFNSIIAQTNVTGGIFNDTTWSLNGSPYIVTDNIALYPGYTLTIEPGVTVKFNIGKKLILRGTLISSGTSEDNITFTSSLSNPSKGNWSGIEIENNQGGKIIGSYIKGEYADSFIKIIDSSSGNIININNSEIKNCNFAFFGYDGNSSHTVVLDNIDINNIDYGFIYAQNVTLTNSVFSNGEKGIHGWNGPNIFISNSEFSNFSIWPFNMEGVIDNCNIHDNAVGIRMKTDLTVKNSIISSNTIGIECNYPFQVSGTNIFDNEICYNSQYNFKHLYNYPVSIPNNYWCTDIESEISQTMFDAKDDVSLGIVTFTPFNKTSSIESSLNHETIFNNKNELYLYPNPASKEIILSEYIDGDYAIYSINGVKIKRGIIVKKINISDLNNGVYFIKIHNRKLSKSIIKKFIKK